MKHEPDFCPMAFTLDQIAHCEAMIAFYEPLANASEPDSLASRQLRRHLGLVDQLSRMYRKAAHYEARRS